MMSGENQKTQPCLMNLASGLSEKDALRDPSQFCSSRVLIVDDEEVSKLILGKICSQLGASFDTADDGLGALELLLQRRFEVVLLDVSMPGMDGFEVLREVRRSFSEAELPVVMVTADDDRESIVAAFRAGANDYITKPFDAETSMVRLSTHLRLQQIQQELSESQQRYTLAVRGTNDGIWDWDILKETVYFSPRWQAMLGLPELEHLDSPNHWFSRVHDNDRKRVHNALTSHLAGQTECFEVELRMHHELGEYRWMLCRGKAVFSDSKAVRMAGSLTDVTEGKSADALTGLPNRALFLERVSHRLQQYLRNPDRPFAVAIIDVDGFKGVNDTYGHAAGDELLVLIARALESSVRQADSVVARIGGDEFAVLVEDVDSQRAASTIAARLVDVISKPALLLERHYINPSASVGITLPTPQARSVEDLLLLADRAMYEAKREGKNGYRAFSPEMRQDDEMRSALLQDLNALVDSAETPQTDSPLQTLCSPIVNVQSGDLLAFECRLAWRHPRYDEARHGVIAEVASDNGIEAAVELKTLRMACSQLALLRREDDRFDSVKLLLENASWRSDRKASAEALAEVVSSEGISPRDIILSFWQHSMDQLSEDEHATISALGEEGFSIALSGCELGRVSLSLLALARQGYLRIGERRTQGAKQPFEPAAELEVVATLAEGLQAGLIYSGVSDHSHLEVLKAIGCKYGQGPLLGEEKSLKYITSELLTHATS
ncbi:MAG: diguanylate cyclase [Planctomycetota bacterium]